LLFLELQILALQI